MKLFRNVVRSTISRLKPVLTTLVHTKHGEFILINLAYAGALHAIKKDKIKFTQLPDFANLTCDGMTAELIVTDHFAALNQIPLVPSIHVQLVDDGAGKLNALISMNRIMANAPIVFRNACIVHEFGHIKYGDLVDAAGVPWVGTVPRDLNVEHRADIFAHEQGEQILGALSWIAECKSNFLDRTEIYERIKLLEAYIGLKQQTA